MANPKSSALYLRSKGLTEQALAHSVPASAIVVLAPKWLDSDDDSDHEPALISDDAFTVLSSSCSRTPSLAPLNAEDAHIDIVPSLVREMFFHASSSSRAPCSRYNNYYSPNQKSSTTCEDIAAALLALQCLHAKPHLGASPSQPLVTHLPRQSQARHPLLLGTHGSSWL